MIADKGDEAEARVLAPLRAAGKTAVIPPKHNRTNPRAYDRAIATRYDKTKRNFLAAIHLAASAIMLS